MNHGIGLKPGINYCVPVGQIGFRGVLDNLARLIPLPERPDVSDETLFFHGVEVAADQLPYLPEMGPGSSFKAAGMWHHYQITRGIFIAHLTPKNNDTSSFEMEWALQVVLFAGEKSPRVFLDERDGLLSKKILTLQDLQAIQDLLTAKQIVLN